MVNLRISGWAITSLASHFACDIEPISTKCKKYIIEPLDKEVYSVEKLALRTLPLPSKTKWIDFDGRRVCLGRSYKDYIKPK